MRLAQFLRSPKAPAALATEAQGLSHAELARAIDDAVKEAEMQDRSTVLPSELRQFIAQRQTDRRRSAGAGE